MLHITILKTLRSCVFWRIGAGRHSLIPTELDAEGACRPKAEAAPLADLTLSRTKFGEVYWQPGCSSRPGRSWLT